MPSEMLRFLDETFEEGDAKGYRFTVHGIIDFEHGRGNIFYEVIDKDGTSISFFMQQFRIENPLFTSLTVSSMASMFAVCVTAHLVGVSGTELYKHYRASKKQDPDFKIADRTSDVIRRFQGSKQILKDTAAGAIAGCLVTAGLS